MDSRFKFRAWDKDRKYMATDGDRFAVDFDGDIQEISYDDYYTNVQQAENLILMQCTGLKDKNGKLIFEGDILHPKGLEKGWANKVLFQDGCFGCIPLYPNLRNPDDHDFSPFLSEGEVYIGDQEIIGNIHENKELLK